MSPTWALSDGDGVAMNGSVSSGMRGKGEELSQEQVEAFIDSVRPELMPGRSARHHDLERDQSGLPA